MRLSYRNIQFHTSEAQARLNLLQAMARWHKTNPRNRAAKSQMAYAAFPGYAWGRPQGAAFAIAKIAKHMERDGVIRYESNGRDWGHVITSLGLEEVARGMPLA